MDKLRFSFVCLGTFSLIAACSPNEQEGSEIERGFSEDTATASTSSDGSLGIGGTSGISVEGCADGDTTLSGTVYDPAGRLPLYNVVVYVPTPGNEPPSFSEGVSCERCEERSASAIAVALSDAEGRFVLEGVPSGQDVPLVLEVGEWRRQVTVREVAACEDNVIEDADLTRLPTDQSEGHIPQIAVSTGHSDALECLFRKLGLICTSRLRVTTFPTTRLRFRADASATICHRRKRHSPS